ncbi:MAG: phosphodiester glycosidase family protein [Actinomycetota bacterium]|nr:phosphodiester glycosidase family protein [Actinomycetota bacterium]
MRLIKIKDPAAPLRIFMITMDLSRRTTLDVGRPSKTISARAPASSIAAKYGAIAAINGDFFLHKGIPRPVHLFVEDGKYVQTGIRVGKAFAYSADESSAFIGRPPVNILAHVPRLGGAWKIDRWNSGTSPVEQIAAYTAAGGSIETPPKDSCWVKLAPAARLAWGDKVAGRLTRKYRVSSKDCTNAAPSVGKKIVLTAPRGSADAQRLASLVVTDRINLTWSLGWPNVADAIAAEPQLLDAGAVVAPTVCGTMCRRNPRTAVGIKADGTVVLVVVDGRSTVSRGMTLVELAQFMKAEGVVTALNLDGGGSSTMVVRGSVVNRPSDGKERAIANALMILPGPDKGQKIA